MDYLKEIEAEKTFEKEHGSGEYAAGGFFIFFDEEFVGWTQDLTTPERWKVGSIAVDESGRMWQAIGVDEFSAGAWGAVVRRGGSRPGAGRKPMKPTLKKQTRSFTLSPETVQALKDLQESLDLPSQSAVVEFLALRGLRIVKEKQLDLF